MVNCFIRDRYVYRGFGDIQMIDKLNVGCGGDYRYGYVNLDIGGNDIYGDEINIDIIHNLEEFPYPFEDNKFEEVQINSVLEHLNNPKRFLEEVHRISKDKAKISITTPHFSSINCWSDITHKRGFTLNTFEQKGFKEMFKTVCADFEVSKYNLFAKLLIKISPRFYENHFAYMFPVEGLKFELEVIKLQEEIKS